MLIRRILVLLHALLLAVASGASHPALAASLEGGTEICQADAGNAVEFNTTAEAAPGVPAAETSGADMVVELPEALEVPALHWSDAALIDTLPDPTLRAHAAPYLEGLQRPPRQKH